MKPLEGGHFSNTEKDGPGSAQFHVNVCNLTLFKVHTSSRKTACAGHEGANALQSVQITSKWSHFRRAHSRAAALRNCQNNNILGLKVCITASIAVHKFRQGGLVFQSQKGVTIK